MKKIFILVAATFILASCSPKEIQQSSSNIKSSAENGVSDMQSKPVDQESSQTPLTEMPSEVPMVSSEPVESPILENPLAPDSNDSEVLTVDDLDIKETPAKQSWQSAYDNFYIGIKDTKTSDIELPNENIKIRENLIYPIYEITTEREFKDFIIEGSNVFEVPCLYGGVLEDKEGNYYGEAGILKDTIDMPYFVFESREFEVGNYNGRTSMTITESLETKLIKGGFNPKTTKAYAVEILTIYGTLFEDGNKKVFYIQNGENYSGLIDLSLLDEYVKFTEPPKVKNPVIANPPTAKPVIYLYPEEEQEVNVKVNYTGNFTYTYPTYSDKGWQVTAYPDGKIINNADESEHYYLFWEGDKEIDWDFTEGFIVSGKNTEQFLIEKLSYMGLTPKEYNDFIVYWTPELMANDYNLITFATTQYEELAPLEITPKPDTVLRVHMVYKKWDKKIQPLPQELPQTERTGFTVVEWGGTRAK